MPAEIIIRTVFEALAVLLFIVALLNEKKLIAFERRVAMRLRSRRTARGVQLREEDVYGVREEVRRSERQALPAAASARTRTRRPRSRRPAA